MEENIETEKRYLFLYTTDCGSIKFKYHFTKGSQVDLYTLSEDVCVFRVCGGVCVWEWGCMIASKLRSLSSRTCLKE